MTLVRHLAIAIVVAVILVAVSVQIGSYRDYQMAEVAAYVVAVAGLTLLIGLSGQISVGNGAEKCSTKSDPCGRLVKFVISRSTT